MRIANCSICLLIAISYTHTHTFRSSSIQLDTNSLNKYLKTDCADKFQTPFDKRGRSNRCEKRGFREGGGGEDITWLLQPPPPSILMVSGWTRQISIQPRSPICRLYFFVSMRKAVHNTCTESFTSYSRFQRIVRGMLMEPNMKSTRKTSCLC